MGLEFGYDKIKDKWYARGFQFLRLYNTEEEMKEDAPKATEAYFEQRNRFYAVANMFAQLRYAR